MKIHIYVDASVSGSVGYSRGLSDGLTAITGGATQMRHDVLRVFADDVERPAILLMHDAPGYDGDNVTYEVVGFDRPMAVETGVEE